MFESFKVCLLQAGFRAASSIIIQEVNLKNERGFKVS